MQALRFIHAADLHLDTVFSGLSKKVDEDFATNLHKSTFIALERLVSLAISNQIDFLILAGDTYNYEEYSLKAKIALRDAFAKLNDYNIPVFIVHGNHDPYSSRLKHFNFTQNVHVFNSSEVENFPVYRNNELIAKIYGISHASDLEGRNLAKMFKKGEEKCLHLGVLHTSLNMENEKYAPCQLEDLIKTQMHYFALGHIHNYKVLSTEPYICYSGVPQGLHIDECGPKGCLLVTAIPETDLFLLNNLESDNFNFEVKFHNLAPLVWQKFEINIEKIDEIAKLDTYIKEVLYNFAAEQTSACQNIIARVVLTGRTKLDDELRKSKNLEELTKIVREHAENFSPKLYVQDIKLQTKNTFDEVNALEREDLLGEILKLSNNWQANERSLNPRIEDILSPILHNQKLKKLVQNYKFDNKQLLADAKRICIDILEKE